jgi:hypothetical protein
LCGLICGLGFFVPGLRDTAFGSPCEGIIERLGKWFGVPCGLAGLYQRGA